jgi:hypothetical protein
MDVDIVNLPPRHDCRPNKTVIDCSGDGEEDIVECEICQRIWYEKCNLQSQNI